jgi:Winged helix DNA-binding domain
MTDQQLQELRQKKWRLGGEPISTVEDARDFIETVGFCTMYPLRPAVLVPTFLGACVGNEVNLPTWQHAFADPRAQESTELMVRLLRSRGAFEANVFGETPFLVAASVFPFFYGLVGDRNPRQIPKLGPRSEYSPLAAHAFQAIQKDGPLSKEQLRAMLGGDLSEAALDRALNDLWSKLRITRVDYTREDGAFWDVLFRWAPDPVREGMHLSVPESLSALISKYVDCVVAAEQSEVEEFFSHLVARSKARDAIHALLAAREFSYVHVGGRAMLTITPPKGEASPRPERRADVPQRNRPLVDRRKPRLLPGPKSRP